MTSRITPDDIIKMVHKHGDLQTHRTGKNTPQRVRARRITAYLLKHVCHMSYPDIARRIKWKSHTSALNAIRKVDDRDKDVIDAVCYTLYVDKRGNKETT